MIRVASEVYGYVSTGYHSYGDSGVSRVMVVVLHLFVAGVVFCWRLTLLLVLDWRPSMFGSDRSLRCFFCVLVFLRWHVHLRLALVASYDNLSSTVLYEFVFVLAYVLASNGGRALACTDTPLTRASRCSAF